MKSNSWLLKCGGALLAVCLFCYAGYLVYCQRQAQIELQNQLLSTRQELEQLHVDHRDTMDAINNALDARDAINEQAKLREERLRRTLKNDPVADMPISDDLRMCLQWDENGNCEVSAAREPASGCENTGSRKDPDGR